MALFGRCSSLMQTGELLRKRRSQVGIMFRHQPLVRTGWRDGCCSEHQVRGGSWVSPHEFAGSTSQLVGELAEGRLFRIVMKKHEMILTR
jgi:hypothetical protein